MPEQLEASVAIARAVARCRPEVVCAYPITPQTHIVEALSRMVRAGELAPCEMVNVESEYSACSVAIGASAAGARAYTATASQGLLYMAEALFNAAGLGLPIVMTVANRAVGAPINIWNDHSDAIALRDSGFIQLYAGDNQEAVDMHVLAFRIAEQLSLPVMVCMDGYVLTHAIEPLELPSQEDVDSFLGPFRPRQVLDPDEPMTIGAMVGPEAFTEVKYLAHLRQQEALDAIPQLASALSALTGRASGGLLGGYRIEDAELVVVAMGSVLGTLAVLIDEMRAEGIAVGALAIRTFRPFPRAEVAAALGGASRIIVLERAIAIGAGGVLTDSVRWALGARGAALHTVIAGLGGRPIMRRSLRAIMESAMRGELGELHFLDLRQDLAERELERSRASARPGPHAEAILKDIGIVAAGPV
jgi:pyruvate ferredoxin oxidoreductase alpha subunit